MSDACLFVSYKQAADPSRLAAYGALAVRAIEQFGGTVIARGGAEPHLRGGPERVDRARALQQRGRGRRSL